MKNFITSLSIVSLCFAGSKFFSSIATVVMARFLGRDVFGEANVILLLAQVVSPLMLFGLHMSVMQFGAGKEKPAPYVSTSFYGALISIITLSCIVWLMTPLLNQWMNFSGHMVAWSLGLAIIICAYTLFTHYYQMANLYKQRGMIELALGACLLPSLAVGMWLTGISYQTILTTYGVAYCICLPPMIWRFRKMLSPRHLLPDNWREMVKYGALACFSGVGFILIFVVQPLQLNYYTGSGEVGVFRLYAASSLSLATFATTIFYTVFFPKVAASSKGLYIWSLLTRAWMRAALPLLIFYAAIFSVSVWLSGPDYPLTWDRILLFSLASVLVTVQTTYGQMVAAQGIKGMRLVLIIGISMGLLNVALSRGLMPTFGINGAVCTLIITFGLGLIAITALKSIIFKPSDSAPVESPSPLS